MKVLLDENLDHRLADVLTGFNVLHVRPLGWKSISNGKLLALAEENGFEVMVTSDKNLMFQQKLEGRSISVVVLDIHPNVLANQFACAESIRATLNELDPGVVSVIEGPHPKRER